MNKYFIPQVVSAMAFLVPLSADNATAQQAATVSSLLAAGFELRGLHPAANNPSITLLYLHKDAAVYVRALVPTVSAPNLNSIAIKVDGRNAGCAKI